MFHIQRGEIKLIWMSKGLVRPFHIDLSAINVWFVPTLACWSKYLRSEELTKNSKSLHHFLI